jgi:hypothetical protein
MSPAEIGYRMSLKRNLSGLFFCQGQIQPHVDFGSVSVGVQNRQGLHAKGLKPQTLIQPLCGGIALRHFQLQHAKTWARHVVLNGCTHQFAGQALNQIKAL